jgi:undecaprenyl-diphosphatase
VRVAIGLKAAPVLLLGLAIHHRFHGPPIDYLTIALAAAASWVGIPGPGEPVLIAGGVFAAQHKLDIGEVLLFAWFGATVGGVAGWYIGMKAGRAVLTTRGPLQLSRRRALTRGEEVFRRATVVAIILTPSWVPGILRVRGSVFLPTNAISALLWSVGIGLGAYFIGPSVVEFVDDLGLVTGLAVVVLILAGVATEVTRRRRRASRPFG